MTVPAVFINIRPQIKLLAADSALDKSISTFEVESGPTASASGEKVRIRTVPDPQNWFKRKNQSFVATKAKTKI